MRSFDELLKESSSVHGHLCAGQVLGVRMAMVGCREVEIDEPKGCKKLIVYVEMDRCATDAIQAVTGCSLGKRSLKFLDYGKMAATFVNLETGKAFRVLARDDARALVPCFVQDSGNPRDAQKKAYAVMPEAALFCIQSRTVRVPEESMPGFRSGRVYCEKCGEGVNLKREVKLNGKMLCIPCASENPFGQREGAGRGEVDPPVVLIVGFKKVGKTALIEKLIPEFCSRGYHVGTIKHHHSDFPVETDARGTDSWKHREAGAKTVALVSPGGVALFRNTDEELSLDQVLPSLRGSDIAIVEGFHREARPKVEIIASHDGERLCNEDKHVVALVGPLNGNEPVPCFEPGIIKPLADLIEREVLGRSMPH